MNVQKKSMKNHDVGSQRLNYCFFFEIAHDLGVLEGAFCDRFEVQVELRSHLGTKMGSEGNGQRKANSMTTTCDPTRKLVTIQFQERHSF